MTTQLLSAVVGFIFAQILDSALRLQACYESRGFSTQHVETGSATSVRASS